MAAPHTDASFPPPRRFRRACAGWFITGSVGVLASAAYMGTSASEVVVKYLGPGAAAIGIGLMAAGGLCLLLGALHLGEYVAIDDVAIEQIRWGARPIRMLWADIDQVILHKSPKRPKGTIELRAKGRSLRIDPRLLRFNELEESILREAAHFGARVTDYRATSPA
jgi:hypothetical protein